MAKFYWLGKNAESHQRRFTRALNAARRFLMRTNAFVLGCLLALGLLIISFVVFGQRTGTAAPKIEKPDDLKQIRTVITDFWKAAKSDDTERAKLYLTEPPESFWTKGTGCDGEPNPPPRADRVEGSDSEAKVVPSRDLHFVTQLIFEKIRNEQPEIVRMEPHKMFGQNAIFAVRGRSDRLWPDYFFLLTSTEDGWKIFLVADGYATFNKNFGECTTD